MNISSETISDKVMAYLIAKNTGLHKDSPPSDITNGALMLEMIAWGALSEEERNLVEFIEALTGTVEALASILMFDCLLSYKHDRIMRLCEKLA